MVVQKNSSSNGPEQKRSMEEDALGDDPRTVKDGSAAAAPASEDHDHDSPVPPAKEPSIALLPEVDVEDRPASMIATSNPPSQGSPVVDRADRKTAPAGTSGEEASSKILTPSAGKPFPGEDHDEQPPGASTGGNNSAASETDVSREFPTDWGLVVPDPPTVDGMDAEFVFSCPSSQPLKNHRVVQADVKRTRAAVPEIVAQHPRYAVTK